MNSKKNPKELKEILKEFDKKITIADFCWKDYLGEKFAKQSQKKIKNFLRQTYLAAQKTEREKIIKIGKDMKFPTKKGGSKEMPYTEYLASKPVHESNEIFQQYFYNKAIDDFLAKLRRE
jgi:hypothetical protein